MRPLGNPRGRLSLWLLQCNAPSADPDDDSEKYLRNKYDNIWEICVKISKKYALQEPGKYQIYHHKKTASKAVTADTPVHQVHIQMMMQIKFVLHFSLERNL